jgi:hypothetical protein
MPLSDFPELFRQFLKRHRVFFQDLKKTHHRLVSHVKLAAQCLDPSLSGAFLTEHFAHVLAHLLGGQSNGDGAFPNIAPYRYAVIGRDSFSRMAFENAEQDDQGD